MRIGILQCGQSPAQLKEGLGDYPDMFLRLLAGRGFEFRNWHVEEMEFPQDIHEADGWLLTGSRHGAYEDHAFIPPLEDLIRRIHDAGMPMVGICFGHQIIAQALGGKVEKFAGGWAVGTQDYDFDGQTVRLNAWHQDQVTRRPAGAVPVGSNAFCENAALIYGDRAFTVQAHPEFEDAFVQGLMDTRAKGVVPQDLLDLAAERMDEPKDTGLLADRIEAFLKAPRTAATQTTTDKGAA
ncbi:type 1 glutamine amidotransferase [Paracoccus sp. 1_MG-2023]|uniref:type 1 glutamine amidotransferase n=1 Tax=unclassified Paracoccus (in: a-proteobacteria) TaxID=2688777 RepID=UPI001C099F99|nr:MULTISPECIES: type 1 glutamine amidotransferase [unclassified Paracoccus (in: a-proteobacteria)]MBU2958126.1 type 1 glutamine amidotransferase [Paracoccus sp. C2R09]MDO6669288.1 type 1 glutamine amidotransferase [Paracoccus sp. 1_MG-2023]